MSRVFSTFYLFGIFFLGSPALASTPWSFYAFSDIHVYKDGTMPQRFHDLVRTIAAQPIPPRFILITGDSTVGNPKDSEERQALLPMWWEKLQQALAPLSRAGIAIYAVAGNHDSYLHAQRQAYANAWSRMIPGGWFSDPTGPSNWHSPLETHSAPFSYSFVVDGILFAGTHIVRHDLDAEVESWLLKELKRPFSTKVVFGHVPFVSVMGRDSTYFEKKMKRILGENRVDFYISGHEHLFWDEFIETPSGNKVREVIVGTASATYTYGFTDRVRQNIRCFDIETSKLSCGMPATGQNFQVKLDNESAHPYQQVHRQVFTEFKVRPKSNKRTPRISVHPRILRENNDGTFSIESFYE